MKITNYNQIPQPIVRAIQKNWYAGAGAQHFCSVTDLIKPTKLFVLARRHQQELSREASELIWSLLGSAMHKVLEASETGESLNEERLYATVNGKTISGGVDLYENGTISDFKFTSVWSYIYASARKEWEEQLNLYSYLYQQAGFEVDKLQIIAVFRDWSAAKAKYQKHYPRQIEIIPICRWSVDRCSEFIRQRLAQMELALHLPDDAIEECTKEERWQDEDVYAIMKRGNKRALKLCKSQQQAQAYMKAHKDREKLYLESRHGEPKRCENYCPVSSYCHYYRDLHPEIFLKAI
jgi:hypothetical protein